MITFNPFGQRRSGVLLHPTSLPGKWGNGDFGEEAYRFIDFLETSGQSVWQILPLGPTHHHGSPYQCLSAHAFNPQLINLENLVERGWLLSDELDDAFKYGSRDEVVLRYHTLEQACGGFSQRASEADKAALQDYVKQQSTWLHDFALYLAIRKENDGRDWSQWPAALRDRDDTALNDARVRLAHFIEQLIFEQFAASLQWFDLKAYANKKGVLIFGDMPIFVAYDSAEVWAQREYFTIDDEGRSTVVAGVPPDYFSATGQRWGNPHYRWDVMEADGFKWWLERMSTQMELFDLLRIDHFRGFEAYWEIPAEEDVAINGHWVKAPGDQLFAAFKAHFGRLPLVAEDLGVITPEVDQLRHKYGLPGMKILQFAFGGDSDNPYLPHNHEHDSIVYTGTHDNNTTMGWYDELSDEERHNVHQYLGPLKEEMPWALIRSLMASVGQMAILPMQDVLELGSDQRMNIPGTVDDNWLWRFNWDQVSDENVARLRDLTVRYGRHV